MFAFIYSRLSCRCLFCGFIFHALLQNIYYLNVGKDLKLLPNPNRTRFLIGTVNNLVLEFENGKIPIWNGTLTFSIEILVIPSVEEKQHFSGIFDFAIPFTAGSMEKIRIEIPLKGLQRGMSRITRVTIDVPHIFGEGSVMMELDEPVQAESLVYPNIIPFTGDSVHRRLNQVTWNRDHRFFMMFFTSRNKRLCCVRSI